jgi:hypothetical protein
MAAGREPQRRNDVHMSRRTNATRAHLTLRIDLDDVDVPAWRSLILDPELGLSDLAEAILLAFGWTGTGTWRFGTSHTPWWGREADTWGCRALTPARIRHVSPYGYDDDWRHPEAEPACHREWTVGEVTDRFDGRLEFEYRQLGLDGERGEPGPAWRHRVVVTERDAASSRSSLPRAAMLGGSGTVPRLGTEGAYGELGDPSWHVALTHEFDLAFGGSSNDLLGSSGNGWSGLDAAVGGASDAARRALRIDLIGLGALAPVQVDPQHAATATAPIRDLLRSATAPDGIELAASGSLGDDLRAVGLARVQKGRLRTLAATRDRLLDDPVALWTDLAERLTRPGYSFAYARRPEVAELAIDLVLGDATTSDVRRFAFDEARSHPDARRLGDADVTRARRLLSAMGLTDDHGRPIHPAARAFGFAMIRG